jgi:hypothetical protein
VSNTHDCYFHSLTTCTGELGGQQVTVLIVDDETGEVYVDESSLLHVTCLLNDQRATVFV